MKKNLIMAGVCFLLAAFLWLIQDLKMQAETAGQIAPYILRFHVRANSNRTFDQQLKLKVKSYILEELYQGMTTDKNSGSTLLNKQTVLSYLNGHTAELEQKTQDFILDQGLNYPVKINVEQCYFPRKDYGDLSFPAGTYEALQVDIGSGRGRNWWCVVYPKICITKDAVATLPESSRKELATLLAPGDYRKLTAPRPDLSIKLDFKLRALLAPTPKSKIH